MKCGPTWSSSNLISSFEGISTIGIPENNVDLIHSSSMLGWTEKCDFQQKPGPNCHTTAMGNAASHDQMVRKHGATLKIEVFEAQCLKDSANFSSQTPYVMATCLPREKAVAKTIPCPQVGIWILNNLSQTAVQLFRVILHQNGPPKWRMY